MLSKSPQFKILSVTTLVAVAVIAIALNRLPVNGLRAYTKPSVESAAAVDCQSNKGQFISLSQPVTIGDTASGWVVCQVDGQNQGYLAILKQSDAGWVVVYKGKDLPSAEFGRANNLPPQFSGGD